MVLKLKKSDGLDSFMKTFISIFLAALAATIAVELNKELLESGIDRSTSLLVSVVVSVLFFQVAKFLLTEFPMRLRIFRKFLDPNSKFEGLYIETFDCLQERPFSVGVLEYNLQSKRYIYSGRAFDKEGVLCAKWNAFDLVLEPGKNMVRHFFTAELLSQASEDVQGYGILDFGTGVGYLVDSGTNLERHHFTFRKLKRVDFHKYTGRFRQPHKDMWGKMAKAILE